MGTYLLDKNNRPVAVSGSEEWARELETLQRHVKVNRLLVSGEKVTVSTVFLGLDQSHGRGGPPILFETLITGGKHDDEMVRYRSRAKAIRRHLKIVKQIKDGK